MVREIVLSSTRVYRSPEGYYIYNINEKGAQVIYPLGQEIIVPIGIKNIYIKIPENYISLIIIESISADRKSILLVVIILGVLIIGNWFSKNMTGYKVIIILLSRYTNKGIRIAWFDYFIKYIYSNSESKQ
jgi:hypothetical protein